LARETHKFEAHYLDWLIGPYPASAAVYKARSPLYQAELISTPIIFFQGQEDEIVPRAQTEQMVNALRRNKLLVGYLLFSGEQHGLRQSDNIRRALDAELYFYAFGAFQTGLNF
jgi:dipeptidyl aminopeptidase/acylaminoacyl peptidase